MNIKALVVNNAQNTIAIDSKQCRLETGGIMVGTLGNPFTIVAAGKSGLNSKHHATKYISDPVADKNCLQAAKKKYGESVVPVGWWHKHPSGFDRPSAGDRRQIRELQKEFNDDKPVLMGIVNNCESISTNIALKLYSLDSNDQLREHAWQLVDDNHPKLLGAISQAPSNPELKDVDFWKDPEFQFYFQKTGRDRILLEIRELKQAGWLVTTVRHREKETLMLRLFDGMNDFQLILPPEYPLNPPQIVTPEGESIITSQILGQWNSLCPLTELADQAARILICDHCKRQFVRK